MINNIKGLPTHCEYCGSQLEWDSVHLVCTNPYCPQKNSADVKAICMNLAPILGLGWKTIEKVMHTPFYENCDYSFNSLGSLLLAKLIPGVAFSKGEQGMFNQMLYTIQHGKFSVSQFLLALNVPGLGEKSAKRIEDSGIAKELLAYMANTASSTNLNSKWIELVQDKNVVFSLKHEYNEKFCNYFDLLFDRIEYKTGTANNVVEEKGEVVITGTLSMKRADFEQLLKENGFKLASSINKNTMYLITNTPDSGTSKNKKADELGVTKITENGFRTKYNI